MVTVRKKRVGKHTYCYLEHTIRDKDRVKKKEKYLGKQLPKNIEELKSQFLSEIYTERWHPLLDEIGKAYSKEVESMPKSLSEKELKTFSIRFTYDTNRIEGSSLTLRETADLIERGITPREKPLKDAKEAEAHEKLFYEMLDWKKDLSVQTVLYWHKRLLESTEPDIAGKLRQHQVAISGSKFIPPFPAEIYPLLNEFFRWYNKNKGKLHPVELVALAHLKFVTIHPFGDGNGRISRLLMNFILHRSGFPMLNISYGKRASYYNALERSQINREDNTFVLWLFRRYVKEYEKYLRD